MLKNKPVLIGIGVLVFLVLLGGIYFLFINKPAAKPTQSQNSSMDSGPQNISAEEIGLELEASDDKQKVRIVIGKPGDLKTIAYELIYEADSTEQERADGSEEKIQRGITGEANIKSGTGIYRSAWLDLGSCSKNVCKYDKGITSIDIILKLTSNTNKVYATEQKLEL